MSEPYSIKKIPTGEDVREMLIKIDQEMRDKYGLHLERMPERPGITQEALHWPMKY